MSDLEVTILTPAEELELTQEQVELAKKMSIDFVNETNSILNRLYTKNQKVEFKYKFGPDVPKKVMFKANKMALELFCNKGWHIEYFLYSGDNNIFNYEFTSAIDVEQQRLKFEEERRIKKEKKQKVIKKVRTVALTILLSIVVACVILLLKR